MDIMSFPGKYTIIKLSGKTSLRAKARARMHFLNHGFKAVV
jgi:hypothetical protein